MAVCRVVSVVCAARQVRCRLPNRLGRDSLLQCDLCVCPVRVSRVCDRVSFGCLLCALILRQLGYSHIAH
eukprot:1746236-Prymnesium_polylepis.2